VATTFQQLLAAMSFDAYRPSRANFIDLVPAGWSVIDSVLSQRHQHDGFDATVFRSNSGQIGIAFRGTDADSLGGILTDGSVAGDGTCQREWEGEMKTACLPHLHHNSIAHSYSYGSLV
jgi:hypothetical protein